MNGSFCVHGVRTGLVRPGDDLVFILRKAVTASPAGSLRDGDILVIAESVVATAEGRAVCLDSVVPGEEARRLGKRYDMDPRLVEVVLRESDRVVGGIPGFLLTLKQGTLLPNAGVDCSNAPPDTVLPLPRDPDQSAETLRQRFRTESGVTIGVIIADSRTHAMRLGCAGVAIGVAGMEAVTDERGKSDLFGRELQVTQRAVADCLASAAELLMGEANESIPAAVVRGLGLPMEDRVGVPSIEASKCLFMGVALHPDPTVLGHQNETP